MKMEKEFYERTPTELLMQATEDLADFEAEHGPITECMIIMQHYDGDVEHISGVHNIKRHSHALGLLSSALASFFGSHERK
jgi:hypothetical protein